MTSYDLAAIFVLSNVAAEPLVYKVTSKAFIGSLSIAFLVAFIGWSSLRQWFYNFDSQPSIVILNGKIDQRALKYNKTNLPFLLSLLRLQGYANVSDVEVATFEPNGSLSVIPRSQKRPVTPKDLKLDTQYEGLALPIIIDGRIQYDNIKYAKLDMIWLNNQLSQAGNLKAENIFLAELSTSGELFISKYEDIVNNCPRVF
jgi:uncharacterized membrane protein YcaP (DUF421 family)